MNYVLHIEDWHLLKNCGEDTKMVAYDLAKMRFGVKLRGVLVRVGELVGFKSGFGRNEKDKSNRDMLAMVNELVGRVVGRVGGGVMGRDEVGVGRKEVVVGQVVIRVG